MSNFPYLRLYRWGFAIYGSSKYDEPMFKLVINRNEFDIRFRGAGAHAHYRWAQTYTTTTTRTYRAS